jgi:hypothetical protein
LTGTITGNTNALAVRKLPLLDQFLIGVDKTVARGIAGYLVEDSENVSARAFHVFKRVALSCD